MIINLSNHEIEIQNSERGEYEKYIKTISSDESGTKIEIVSEIDDKVDLLYRAIKDALQKARLS